MLQILGLTWAAVIGIDWLSSPIPVDRQPTRRMGSAVHLFHLPTARVEGGGHQLRISPNLKACVVSGQYRESIFGFRRGSTSSEQGLCHMQSPSSFIGWYLQQPIRCMAGCLGIRFSPTAACRAPTRSNSPNQEHSMACAPLTVGWLLYEVACLGRL